ncbi:MAG TPA: SusC/RagA family TonB-linked outer membrane protein [Bacteroidales bacterium]|nr:SusC/RagA family TonB-linked outer membrane protein [Bacteroidales bacterium]HQG53649.1 SusC/RagA family TonB-linked outer membrane protein [Bacteroidales bacterium]HQJ20914.1 SusC/RagA family TonB-linked outer membrane protein [Bacteroidales bacterium]
MQRILFFLFVFSGLALQMTAQQKPITGVATGAKDNQTFTSLEPDESGLDEDIIVGYGSQNKSYVTSSISKVDGEKLMNKPVPTIELALQGKSAGVFIEAVNGKSTAFSRVRIRGTSSIYATSQPLFIVDGIPVTMDALNLSGAAINPLASINFNDVESVEILKDAASSAIYGSRGANGVVIINTKKGFSGDTKINFSFKSGFSDPSHRREFMNADEYISYLREAAVNGDLQEDKAYGYSPGTISFWENYVETKLKNFSGWAAITDKNGNYLGSKVDTDWQDLAFRRGTIYSADLSAQGGNDKLRFYAGGSFNSQEGILVSNGIEKASGRLNIENKANKFTDVGFSLALSRTAINQVPSDNFYSNPLQLVALSPITPPRDEYGELYNRPVTAYYNSLLDVEYATVKITEYRSLVNGYLNFNLFNGMKWKNELGFDLYNLKENARYGEKTDAGTGVNGYGFANSGQNQNITGRSYLDYTNIFGNLDVSGILGTEYQYVTSETLYAEGQEFPVDALKTLASANNISGASSTLTKYNFLSYFSRVNLVYNAKYLLTLTCRVDGSSRFGINNQYGFFPAASIGWIVSKEDFFAGVPVINFLKVRSSYGVTGNADISDFGHMGLYDAGSYNGISGLIPGQIQNPDFKWETTKQFDAGIDFGLYGNKIYGEIDVYHKKSNGILLPVQIPATSGFSVQMQNTGSIQNKGFEILLTSNNLSGNITWNTSLNFSVNKNKVLDIGGQDIIDNGGIRYMNVVKKGYPIGVFYGAEYAGVDYYNGDALWYINERDANGNIVNPDETTNVFDDVNFVFLGNPNPDYIGAITNTFGYKGVEFEFTFQGVAGNKIHLIGDQWMASNGVWYDNQLKSQLKSWKNTGDVTMVPQARFAWDNGNQSRSSRYLSDGSYLKLRNVTLSYEFPQTLTNKINLSRLKIFFEGQNLLTFTQYEGWDPEVSADFLVNNIYSGCDFYSAPQPRSVVFGINISF